MIEQVISKFQKESVLAKERDHIKHYKLVKKLQSLTLSRRCKILDAGCERGYLLSAFARNHDCYGIDINSRGLLVAAQHGLIVHSVNLEMDKFPFASDYFDIVVCSEVIEHIFNPDNLLAEINRVLRLDGYLLLTFPNVNQPVSLLIQALLDLPPMYAAHYKSPHVRDYTKKVTQHILKTFGFSIVSINGTYVYPFKGKLSQLLSNYLPRLAEKVIITAIKTRQPHRTATAIWDSRQI